MTDPIAEAAAQLNQEAASSSTEPSMLERANETIHALEAKIEHLIHPEAASEPQAGSVAIENKPSLEQAPIATEAPAPEGELGNVFPAASTSQGDIGAPGNASTESPTSTNTEAKTESGAGEIPDMTPAMNGEVTHVVTGSKSAADAIRTHLAAIKSHLSKRGFEVSLVSDIHAEIAAIDSLL